MGAKASFPLVSIEGKNAVVTGANTGIGYEIAKWLGVMGANVVIACRSEERGKQAISRMQSDYADLKTNKKIGDLKELSELALKFMPLDLSSFASTLKFADDIKKGGQPLHILVCNAGVMGTPLEKTEDGYELMLQVNYLSHFLLTAKLLPVMLRSGDDCRIINVSSEAHRMGDCDLDTMNYSGDPAQFKRMTYYGRSKLYQIMQTKCMARRLGTTEVSVYATHPGAVRTELTRGMSDMRGWMCLINTIGLLGQIKEPLEGATTIINCAVNPDLKGVSGHYYSDCKDSSISSEARNQEKQEALWKKTMELLKDKLTDEEIQCMEGENLTR